MTLEQIEFLRTVGIPRAQKYAAALSATQPSREADELVRVLDWCRQLADLPCLLDEVPE